MHLRTEVISWDAAKIDRTKTEEVVSADKNTYEYTNLEISDFLHFTFIIDLWLGHQVPHSLLAQLVSMVIHCREAAVKNWSSYQVYVYWRQAVCRIVHVCVGRDT